MNRYNPLSLPFSEVELELAINNRRSKAAGVDNISYKIIDYLDRDNRNIIRYIFHCLLAHSYVPPDWKTALVVPIPKPGKPIRFRLTDQYH